MATQTVELIGGKTIKARLRRAEQLNRIRAFGLVVPLLLFILVFFITPIAAMLFRSVDNQILSTWLPRTTEAIATWDGNDLPDEATYAGLADDILAALEVERRSLGQVGSRLNYELSGMRTLFNRTPRGLRRVEEGPWKEAFIGIDPRWGEIETWAAIQAAAPPLTARYYLTAVDLRLTPQGALQSVPADRAIYVDNFIKTLWISISVTLACLILGFPIAYWISILPARHGNLLMILVLLPFWTSLLVRTTSWIVLLQSQGVINDILVFVGIVADENRIQMIYNTTGTVIAMTHILLPFMVLPLYSVMRTIPPSLMRAGVSLGAPPTTAFLRIYLPQTVPGVGAGCLLVFILAIGYYITPALVGGSTGQMISNFIAYHMKTSLNWGLASALGALLLAGVLVLYWLFNKVVGIDRLKLG